MRLRERCDIRRDLLPGVSQPLSSDEEDRVVSTNPRIGAAWYVRPGAGSSTKLRAAAGTGIRPPDAFEIAFTDNPALKPERIDHIVMAVVCLAVSLLAIVVSVITGLPILTGG